MVGWSSRWSGQKLEVQHLKIELFEVTKELKKRAEIDCGLKVTEPTVQESGIERKKRELRLFRAVVRCCPAKEGLTSDEDERLAIGVWKERPTVA